MVLLPSVSILTEIIFKLLIILLDNQMCLYSTAIPKLNTPSTRVHPADYTGLPRVTTRAKPGLKINVTHDILSGLNKPTK